MRPSVLFLLSLVCLNLHGQVSTHTLDSLYIDGRKATDPLAISPYNSSDFFIKGITPYVFETSISFLPADAFAGKAPHAYEKITCDDPAVTVSESKIPAEEQRVGPAITQRFEMHFKQEPSHTKTYHLKGHRPYTPDTDFEVRFYVPITLEEVGYLSQEETINTGISSIIIYRKDFQKIDRDSIECACFSQDPAVSAEINTWMNYDEALASAKRHQLPIPKSTTTVMAVDVRNPHWQEQSMAQLRELKREVSEKDAHDPRFYFAKIEIKTSSPLLGRNPCIYTFFGPNNKDLIRIPIEHQ
jgi:hypothetical protein